MRSLPSSPRVEPERAIPVRSGSRWTDPLAPPGPLAGPLEPAETLAARGVSAPPCGGLQRKRAKRGGPGGVRGGRSLPRRVRKKRVPQVLGPVELAYSAPVQGQGVGGEMAADFAAGLGVELPQVGEDSGVLARARVLRWMDPAIRTRPSKRNPAGLPRRERVQRCGTLWAARCGEQLGMAHKWCRDRMCPTCAERRQRGEARKLRRWCEERWKKGARLIFPTLTQVKQSIELETAEQAITRLMTTRREMMNTKTKAGESLRGFIAGGVWCVELAWSYRGKLNRDGSRVAYSGWHPHLHGLIELTEPDADLVARLGHDRAVEVWARRAGSALRRAWIAVNPEASYAAQKIVDVDRQRVGQVTKYPLKPFEMAAPSRSREAAIALASRRTQDAWGTWQSWRREAEKLLDADREEAGEVERPPIEFGDATFQALAVRVQVGGRVFFHPPGGEDRIGVPTLDLVAAIQEDPRSFQRRVADEGAPGDLLPRGPPGEESRDSVVPCRGNDPGESRVGK